MSFVAAIDEPRNIASWARACTSLSGVSEQVTFTVSAKAVTMLAVNASKTTHGEIGFERNFFKEIRFDTEDIIEDGFTKSDSTYSFVVSSKHLVMLLKNSDPLTFNYVCLKVECSSFTPLLRQFKLEVEILAKSLVLKKYQIGFLPVEYKGTDIPARYDMLWHENDLSKFTIEAPIIKQFLDTSHASAEDFGVETRSSNIIFTAYTKQVVKDRDFLKQPMSISIQMAIDDLHDSNLGDTKVCLNFRLRDFKNFISLVWSLRAVDGSNLDQESLCFDALFKVAGDPILLRYRSESLSIKFIQMTTDDSGNVSKQDAKTYVITAPIVQKRKPFDPESQEVNPAKKAKRTRKRYAAPTAVEPGIEPEYESGLEPELEPEPEHELGPGHRPAFEAYDAFDDYNSFDPTEGHVTYRAQDEHNLQPTVPEPPSQEGTDYNTSADESSTELGPTQARDRPEPLFR